MFKILASFALVLIVSACAGSPDKYGKSSIPPEMEQYQGVFKLGNPYQIGGKWYYPTFDDGYDEVGTASWYGPGFHGKKTANGEVFNKYEMTAAHPTLPLPSIVRVTNLENGLTATVRINDRGPFKSSRIIDLSKKSAEALGVIRTGTAKVRVKYLREETEKLWASLNMKDVQMHEYAIRDSGKSAELPSITVEDYVTTSDRISGNAAPVASVSSVDLSPAKTANSYSSDNERVKPQIAAAEPFIEDSKPEPVTMRWKPIEPGEISKEAKYTYLNKQVASPSSANKFIQAGAFGVKENAYNAASKLSHVGPANVIPVEVNSKTIYRVRVGPFTDLADASDALSKVMSLGHNDAKIINQ